MWKFEDDRTATVLTAREHVACGHNGPVVSLPETAILFYMHSGPQYLQEHYPCTLLTEKLPRFLQGGPVWKLDEKICFLDGGRGAPQAVDTIEPERRARQRAVSGGHRLRLCGERAPGRPD